MDIIPSMLIKHLCLLFANIKRYPNNYKASKKFIYKISSKTIEIPLIKKNRLYRLCAYNSLKKGCSSIGSVPMSLAASAMKISAIPQAGKAIFEFSIGPNSTKSPPTACWIRLILRHKQAMLLDDLFVSA